MALPKAILFDMDGVVCTGAQGIPGVAREIHRLQKIMRVLYLTNNATQSRLEFARRLSVHGIGAKLDEIMTSAYGCAHYVKEKYGAGRSVFVVGERGFCDEMEQEAKAKLCFENAEIVVVGLDRQIGYSKLAAGVRNLNAGAKFIVANADPTYPSEHGAMPGGGAIAAALAYAAGRQPDAVIGKPSTYLAKLLLEKHGVKPKDAVFVGDRMDIDVRMANKMGMKSVLVLSGIAKKEDLRNVSASDRPDIVVGSAAGLGKALGIWKQA